MADVFVTRTCIVCGKPTRHPEYILCDECIDDIKWLKRMRKIDEEYTKNGGIRMSDIFTKCYCKLKQKWCRYANTNGYCIFTGCIDWSEE